MWTCAQPHSLGPWALTGTWALGLRNPGLGTDSREASHARPGPGSQQARPSGSACTLAGLSAEPGPTWSRLLGPAHKEGKTERGTKNQPFFPTEKEKLKNTARCRGDKLGSLRVFLGISF